MFTAGVFGFIANVYMSFMHKTSYKYGVLMISVLIFEVISILFLVSNFGINMNIHTGYVFLLSFALFIALYHFAGKAAVSINKELGYQDSKKIYILTILGFLSSLWLQHRLIKKNMTR